MNCDAVIHLAGVLGTSELFQDPYRAVDVNIKGTLQVLQACQALSGARYVGITMPQVWDNVYQATKLCSAKLASAWHRHFDIPVSHVRAFNAFGEGQKVYGVQKIIPTFATMAWAGEPLPVWGDGEQLVDLVYVKDVARMLVDAMQFEDDRTFDAGTGQPITVNEVARLIQEMTGHFVGIDHLPMRSGEHGHGIVAEGEGWADLGWAPDFRLEELMSTVAWYKPEFLA
jgi:UDP-glucose 4-epimerase